MSAIEATDAIETQPAWGAIKNDLRLGIAFSCSGGAFSYEVLNKYSHGSPDSFLVVGFVFCLFLVSLFAKEAIPSKLRLVFFRDDKGDDKEISRVDAETDKARVVGAANGSMIASWLAVFSGMATLEKATAFSVSFAIKGFYESFWLGFELAAVMLLTALFAFGAVRGAKDAKIAAKRLLIYKP